MDPYRILGVTKSCGAEELKEAFRTKALFMHPDRGGETADFIRLRQAYDQIANELTRRAPGPTTASPGGTIRNIRHRHEPNPNWEPDLIVLDEPLSRIRPVRPPGPDWEPDLIVRDEPLPRIRPPRPPDASWKPDLIVGDGDNAHAPVPQPAPDPGVVRQQYIGWLRGVHISSQIEVSPEREGWYTLAGLTALATVVILGIWMASQSPSDLPPAKPSDLTSSPWSETLPGAGKRAVPDWHDSSSRVPQVRARDRPDTSAGAGQLLPR